MNHFSAAFGDLPNLRLRHFSSSHFPRSCSDYDCCCFPSSPWLGTRGRASDLASNGNQSGIHGGWAPDPLAHEHIFFAKHFYNLPVDPTRRHSAVKEAGPPVVSGWWELTRSETR